MAENFLDGSGAKPFSWWMFEDASSPSLDGNTANNNDLGWFNGTPAKDTTAAKKAEATASLSCPTTADQALSSFANLAATTPFKGATAEFTIGGWVYVTGNAATRTNVSFSNSSSEGFRIGTIATGKFRAIVYGNVTADLSGNDTFASAGLHHVVLRWNGQNTTGAGANDELSLWVDGVKQTATGTLTSVNLVSASNFVFAGAVDGITNFDEWFLFSTALLDTQIADIYTYGLAPVTCAVTGTATSTINEGDIVTGGKTLILTLTNDTWVASGATFDAIRQDIIDGLDSAQSELTGWNNEVRDNLAVSTVARTSDTAVTITLSAQAAYAITANETITITVPATALVGGTPAVVATEQVVVANLVADLSNWTETDTANKLSLTTAANRTASGGYGVQVVHDGTTTPSYISYAVAGDPREIDVTFTTAFVNGTSWGNNQAVILDWRSTVPDSFYTLYFRRSGTSMQVRGGFQVTTSYQTICTSSDTATHTIRIQAKASNAGAGHHRIIIDGVTVYNVSGFSTTDKGVASVRLGGGTFIGNGVGTPTQYFDDVVITDGTDTLLSDDFSAGAASCALSGTITADTDESDIVAGGKTIILTLGNDTWVTAGATFDAQRQNIINGLDSAQAEAAGWNAQVRDTLAVGTVVRTSDTVVTITLSAQAAYVITANETITMTVPATAVTGAAQLTATPTFSVTNLGTPPSVYAGPDQSMIFAAQPVTLSASAFGMTPTQRFWSKISGPGEATFSYPMFDASFEDGTVSEWTAGGTGEETPGANTFVTPQFAHSGTYSWAGYNDPAIVDPVIRYSAKLLRWSFDLAEGMYSAWYWWPSTYSLTDGGGYVNIFQYKEDGAPFDPPWIIAGKRYGSEDHFGIHDYFGADITDTGVQIPKDEAFQLVAYMKASTTVGRFIVWLVTAGSTVKLADRQNINTLGTRTTLMWGVGNYGDGSVGDTIYIDDTVVADATIDPSDCTVEFSAAGTYVLRFTAYDGTDTVYDDVTITLGDIQGANANTSHHRRLIGGYHS
jgi:hypothetical protein